MAFADFIIDCIEAVLAASCRLKFALASTLTALVLHICGFLTSHWLTGEGRQGLWTYCEHSDVYECCSSIEFHVSKTSSVVPAFIYATRVFLAFGLIGAITLTVFITICIYRRPSRDTTEERRKILIISLVTAGSILLGSIIYGGNYKNEKLTFEYTVSSSYNSCIVAGIILFGLWIVYAYDECKTRCCNDDEEDNSSTGSQDNLDPSTEDTSHSSTGYQDNFYPGSEYINYSYTSYQDNIYFNRDDIGYISTSYQGILHPSTEYISHSSFGYQENRCLICLSEPIKTYFVPCGHQTSCESCSRRLFLEDNRCPLCRTNIREIGILTRA